MGILPNLACPIHTFDPISDWVLRCMSAINDFTDDESDTKNHANLSEIRAAQGQHAAQDRA